MFCSFAHKRARTQVTKTWVLGLIWLRHECARMGHQIAAYPTVRYILRGKRNQSVAVHSLSFGN